MKISTRGRYGLRTLVDIATHQHMGLVSLNDIATRQNISPKYLWQVLNPLRTAGMLNVTRGAHGGYALAQPPERILLLDIVNILEGPVAVVDCLLATEPCERANTCACQSVWSEINTALVEALRHVTLADILERHRRLGGAADYVI